MPTRLWELVDRLCPPRPAVQHVTRASVSPDRSSLDLRSCHELTFRLLDDARSWKERLVHEIELGDSDHVRATSTYQVRLPLDLIQKFAPEARSGDVARLLLPLTVRPKELLLDVHLRGPNGSPCFLLLREEGAWLQAEYLSRLADDPGAAEVTQALWFGICSYTPALWRSHSTGRGRRDAAIARYLNGNLAVHVEQRDVGRWLAALEPARLLLLDALGEEPEPDSAAECMLLALPFMELKPVKVQAIDDLVHQFDGTVRSMKGPTREVLAEYGRRWEVLLEVAVPVEEACSVSLSERRPWPAARARTLEQQIPFGDAKTTHVEIRSADHDVVMQGPWFSDLAGLKGEFAVGDAVRDTADAASIYASGPNRSYLACIRIRVRVRRARRMLIGWLLVMIAAAATTALALPEDQQLVDSLALLTFPLTLAGAVVLSRETSDLAERLLRRWRLALGLAILGLWCLTLARLLLSADVPWAEGSWEQARDALGSLRRRLPF